MKKLLLALLMLSSTVLAYNVEIINDTEFSLDVAPRFAAWANDKKPTHWNVKPKEKFKHNTTVYCLQSMKIEAKDVSGKVVGTSILDTKGKDAGIKSTGAGIRCGDFRAIVTATPGADGVSLTVKS